MYGELIPVGGGDPIPLLKKTLLIGRRESCDIVLRFANVSAHHCQLVVNGGFWYIKDSGSKNGVKVNGMRVSEKRLDPGDKLSVAKHDYEIQYSPFDLGAEGPPPPEEESQDIMKVSLLERAGLAPGPKKSALPDSPKGGKSIANDDDEYRYDILEDRGGQFRDPDKPI
jgi:adenylate cyclase